jgi:hypothetical protein
MTAATRTTTRMSVTKTNSCAIGIGCVCAGGHADGWLAPAGSAAASDQHGRTPVHVDAIGQQRRTLFCRSARSVRRRFG